MKKEDLRNYKNIIFSGSVNNILVANYSLEYIREYNIPNNVRKFNKLPIMSDEYLPEKVIELNSLFVLNKYLKRIKQLKESEENNNQSNVICNIILKDKLYDKITKGTYKYWIKEKITSSGKAIDKKELELWEDFKCSYKEVFEDVKFSNINKFKGEKTPKYNIESVEFVREIALILDSLNEQSEEKILKSLLG